MIHWQRRKKIQAALEAETGNPKRKVTLSDKKIADLLAYVKRHFVETAETTRKSTDSAMAATGSLSKAYLSSHNDLDNYIKENRNKIFTQYLMDQLHDRDLSITGLYKMAGLHRSVKQKIELSSDLDPYQPDKDTAIKMGIAMQMNLDEMNKLLAVAGFALSMNNKKEIVIMYCINEKIYDRFEVDAMIEKATGKSMYIIRK